jgi:type IV pilus assembly protein PilX
MTTKSFRTILAPVNNEGGFTLILALILLMLMTVIGVAAINTSTTETMITSSDEEKRTAFYAADSAIEQATALVKQRFRDQFQPSYNMSPDPDRLKWSFALDHSDTSGTFGDAALPSSPSDNWKKRWDNGVRLLSIPDNTPLGNGYSYSVRIWNNTDSPPPSPKVPEQTDTDGLIILGAIARGPRNSLVAVEVTLNGGIEGTSIVGTYTAQAGGGAGKNYNASDVGAISAGNLGTMSNPGGQLN